MVSFVRLKIVRRIYDQSVPGYSNTHKLYLAEEISPASFNAHANTVYLLSPDEYNPGYHVNLDTEQQEEFKNIKNGMFRGNRIFVEREKALTPTGHFEVISIADTGNPVENFRNVSIDRSKYVLYETKNVLPDGKTGNLCRVFSAVSPGYWKGEGMPAAEVKQIFPVGTPDNHKYYLHDLDLYTKRVVAAMPRF